MIKRKTTYVQRDQVQMVQDSCHDQDHTTYNHKTDITLWGADLCFLQQEKIILSSMKT